MLQRNFSKTYTVCKATRREGPAVASFTSIMLINPAVAPHDNNNVHNNEPLEFSKSVSMALIFQFSYSH